MVETELMAKDKTFNLRLDGQDRKRLDDIAAHYSAPAATAVRMLIKEKHDQLIKDDAEWRERRWFRFVESLRRRIQLSEVPNLKVNLRRESLSAVLTDGKRERVVGAETEPEGFVVLNNWPGSQLQCDEDGLEYNERTGLDADGVKVAGPKSPAAKKR